MSILIVCPHSLNINPSTCTFPHACNQHPAQTTIKAEPTACNNYTSYLFVLRHGGSGEPALPLTEALDWGQKEKDPATKVTKECSKLISVQMDRSSYGRDSHAYTGSNMAQTPGRERVGNQAEDLWHSGTKHLRISGNIFWIIRCGF